MKYKKSKREKSIDRQRNLHYNGVDIFPKRRSDMMKLIRQITTTEKTPMDDRIRTGGIFPSELSNLPPLRNVKWRGFGGCLNEAGIAALDTLPPSLKKNILDDLFLPERMGLNFCRLPIGANDYALEWYSCDETSEDYSLRDFSIARDKHFVLRYAKEALARNPNIEFFASPWSPPSWMKEPARYCGGHIRSTPEVLSAYARYLMKWLRAYEEEGIHVSILLPQNEWASDNIYPTCLWTGEMMREFIAKYLGPALETSGLTTELWLGTINGTGTLGGPGSRYNEYTNIVLDDPEAFRHIRGVAYQWEGKAALRPSVESYPELEYMQSENECGDGSNSWEYANYVFELMRLYITGGVCAYCYWNAVLPKGGESSWGWKQNSMITTERGTAHREYEYYIFYHAAGFVRRGAQVLRLSGRMSGNAFGFINPDGTHVIVIQNPFPYEKSISYEGASYTLMPRSVTTLLFSDTTEAPFSQS